MAYRFARFIIRLFIRLITSVEIQGLHQVNLMQSCIIASNHLGRLDAALVFVFIDRQDLLLLVAEKYRNNRVWRFFVKSLNLLFVDRFNADMTALRACLNFLKKGGVVLLAPEGTRSPTASLQAGRSGTGYLAWKAGVPVIPVGVAGSEDRVVFPNLRRLRRSKITVRIGAPIPPPVIDTRGAEREAAMEQYTTEVMCQIAALLPPPYRGFYADHPRLKEILSGQSQASTQDTASPPDRPNTQAKASV
jgi:1-acyl-sn-glycerol-3-phosphate acyltransferase